MNLDSGAKVVFGYLTNMVAVFGTWSLIHYWGILLSNFQGGSISFDPKHTEPS
jgi:hypothetical protein